MFSIGKVYVPGIISIVRRKGPNTMGVKTEPRNVFCEELTNYRDALY